ncbi:hypothetical protein [Zavarzinia sp. CC-PAN008]|uniref:hypothetical protein n=1 Tax=Zavarzinia sp. CC-PAN008 TaxID=3243332 RepID=UPI003F744FCD
MSRLGVLRRALGLLVVAGVALGAIALASAEAQAQRRFLRADLGSLFRWEGQPATAVIGGRTFFDDPATEAVLAPVIGSANYAYLRDRMIRSLPVTRVGDSLIAAACLPEACASTNTAVIIDTVRGDVYACEWEQGTRTWSSSIYAPVVVGGLPSRTGCFSNDPVMARFAERLGRGGIDRQFEVRKFEPPASVFDRPPPPPVAQKPTYAPPASPVGTNFFTGSPDWAGTIVNDVGYDACLVSRLYPEGSALFVRMSRRDTSFSVQRYGLRWQAGASYGIRISVDNRPPLALSAVGAPGDVLVVEFPPNHRVLLDLLGKGGRISILTDFGVIGPLSLAGSGKAVQALSDCFYRLR